MWCGRKSSASESHRFGFKSLLSITGYLWIKDGYHPFATPPIKMWSLVPLLQSGLASDCFDQQTLAEALPQSVQAAERMCKPSVQTNNNPAVSTLSPRSSHFWSPFLAKGTSSYTKYRNYLRFPYNSGGTVPTRAQCSKDDSPSPTTPVSPLASRLPITVSSLS